MFRTRPNADLINEETEIPAPLTSHKKKLYDKRFESVKRSNKEGERLEVKRIETSRLS